MFEKRRRKEFEIKPLNEKNVGKPKKETIRFVRFIGKILVADHLPKTGVGPGGILHATNPRLNLSLPKPSKQGHWGWGLENRIFSAVFLFPKLSGVPEIRTCRRVP